MGSITHVLDCGGKVLNRYGYDAFGNFAAKEETVGNRFGFTGEIRDAFTGQYYLRARFYSPAVGRFLIEDTYYGDGLNLYEYCHGNPVGYVDPSGHVCEQKYRGYREEGYSASEAYIKANADMLAETEGIESAKKYIDDQYKKLKDQGYKFSDSFLENCDPVTAGVNYKDHFIRHKKLLEDITGEKYTKFKIDGDRFLNDIEKVISDKTITYQGLGTLKKGMEQMKIYRGNGVTIVLKVNNEFVTILKSGEGMDLAIQMCE